MRNITFDLSKKLKNTQQTPINNADPKMSIQVSRARTTVMDSEYWTVETIREKSGLGEVSVAPRRDTPYGSPNQLYEIHVDNGMVTTAIREYPDKLKDGWKNQFSVGPGISVAIAFDGYWSRYRNLWRPVTEEKPWIFWVDNDNVLWKQLWDDAATKKQLATEVVKVKAIRAWKNINMPDQDQGLIVGYIKTDGTVWYRNYCQQKDYSYSWESERQLTLFTGNAVNLNMFITNDYRMGFTIEDTSQQVHWLITPRNWGGMAVEPHTVNVSANTSISFIAVKHHQLEHQNKVTLISSVELKFLFGRTDNSIDQIRNLPMVRLDKEKNEYEDWGFKVRITLKYASVTVPVVTLYDTEWNAPIPVSYVERVDDSNGFQFDVYIDDVAAKFGLNTSQGAVAIQVSDARNEAGHLHDTMTDEFIPINLVFPDLPLPKVEVIWNE